MFVRRLVGCENGPEHADFEPTLADRTSEILLVRAQPVVDADPAKQVAAWSHHWLFGCVHADVALVLLLLHAQLYNTKMWKISECIVDL